MIITNLTCTFRLSADGFVSTDTNELTMKIWKFKDVKQD